MAPVDISCQQFVELVTDYLEGTLPGDLSASIEAHLDICDGCRLYIGQMRLTVRALRAHGAAQRHGNGARPVAAPSDEPHVDAEALPAALTARLLAHLKQDGGA